MFIKRAQMGMQIPRYRVLREIGRGQNSIVYLAIQEGLERRVALKLKLIAPEGRNDGDVLARLRAYSENAIRLNHGHIAPIYDTGICEHGYYLAMEYLPGGNLNRRLSAKSAQLDRNQVRALLLELADALGHAFKQGIIHQNIKPHNILFREDGTVVLTDFAAFKTRIYRRSESGDVDTSALFYMSPEQAHTGKGSMQSDQYCLGIILYECLTGDVLSRGGDTLSFNLMRLKRTMPELPEKYADFQVIMNRLLARHPDHRYPSWEAFGDAVKKIPVADVDAGASQPDAMLKQAWYSRSVFAGLAFFSVVAAGAVLYFSDEGRQETGMAGLVRKPSTASIVSPQPAGTDAASDDLNTISAASIEPQDSSTVTDTRAPPELITQPLLVSIASDDAIKKIALDEESGQQHRETAIDRAELAANRSDPAPISVDYFDETLSIADPVDRDDDHGELQRAVQIDPDTSTDQVKKANMTVAGSSAPRQGEQAAPQAASAAGEATQTQEPGAGEQSAEIVELLAEGKSHMDASRFSLPYERSALRAYRQVLELDPQNQQAKIGMAAIATKYAEIARDKHRAGQYKSAAVYIQRGLNALPQDRTLLALQRQTSSKLQEQKDEQNSATVNNNTPAVPPPASISTLESDQDGWSQK